VSLKSAESTSFFYFAIEIERMLQEIKVLEGHSADRVWHVSWSSDGTHLASCGEDKNVRIWTTSETKRWEDAVCICTLEEGTQTRTLRSCEWSPDNKKIASASFCGIVAVWETQTSSRTVWDQLASLEGHENEVKSVSWSPDGTFLASCGRDKKIWLWEDVGRGEIECVCILDGHSQDVKFVRWHPRDNILFSASYDDSIKVWTENDGDWYCADTLTQHSSTVWSLALNADGTCLVSCSDDRTVNVWRQMDGKWTYASTLEDIHSQSIYSIDWSVFGSLLATGGGDNKIALLQLQSDFSVSTLSTVSAAHEGDVNCVRYIFYVK
jgi:WD40 repeat protein